MTFEQKGSERGSSAPAKVLPYHCGRLRGVCVEGYESLDLTTRPWEDLKARRVENHYLAKSSRTRCVVRLEYTPPGQPPRGIYAKRVLVRDWRKRFGCLFVPSKARHEWKAGYRLPAMGIATARPVVCAELWEGFWLVANFLVTEEIAGARAFDLELVQLRTLRERRALWKHFAEWLWQVHRRGFYHDDCSAQHIFVGPCDPAAPDARPPLAFIDLDNSRFYRGAVAWRRRVKNLFQVLRSISPKVASRVDRYHFVRCYLDASGETRRLREAVGRMRRLARAKQAEIHL